MSQVLTQPVRGSRWLKSAALFGLGLGLAAVVLLLPFFWPFRLDAVTKELGDESSTKLTAGSFHATYFPHPGCVLEQSSSNTIPKAALLTVERITVKRRFAGIFARHVTLILVEGVAYSDSAAGSEHFSTPQRSSVVVDDLIADGTTLEVASRQAGNRPLQFVLQQFSISNIGSDAPAAFKATLSNPEPPGEITTTGGFGPWNAREVGTTAVSGDYRFAHADLGAFRGISAELASSGKYTGTLEHIGVQGSTDVPLFAVRRSSSRPTPDSVRCSCKR